VTPGPGQNIFSLGLGFDGKKSGSSPDRQDAGVPAAPAQSLLAIRPSDRTPRAPAEDVLAAVRALLSAAGIGAAGSQGVTLRTPAGTTVTLDDGGRALIGRQPAAEIVVTDARISRRHCEVAITEEGAAIEDLRSTNGTWLQRDGVRLPLTPGRPLRLQNGDLIYCEDLLIATVSPTGGEL
jgi:hypothetical protein